MSLKRAKTLSSGSVAYLSQVSPEGYQAGWVIVGRFRKGTDQSGTELEGFMVEFVVNSDLCTIFRQRLH